MNKLFTALLVLLLSSTVAMACGYRCQCPTIDTDGFASVNDIDNTREDMTRMSAISSALASVELDPTRDGLSMGVALGIADFANGSDEIGEAVGIMYGRDDKAVNIKYGRSGSYSSAGVGITVGF